MTQATINGNTYSDDGTSARDMLNGGHRRWFLPMVGDVTTVAGVVAGHAAQTAIDAATATNGAEATKGTSTTSLAVSAGTKTLTTQADKQFTAGNFVTISRTSAPATMMHGVVTSYSGTTLVVSAATSAGSGTYTDWTIALSGPQGATGAVGTAGDITRLAKTAAYTVTAADKAKLVDCTGTFVLSFQACATLGANWVTYVSNSGGGRITMTPYAGDLIDGVASFTMYPGEVRLVHCDGSALRSIVLKPFEASFTTSGTFYKPPGYKLFCGYAVGSGGSGGKGSSGTYAGGGGGAAAIPFTIHDATMPGTVAMVVSATTPGVTAANTSGAVGGASNFGTFCKAWGGGGGFQQATFPAGGGGGGGSSSAGGMGGNQTTGSDGGGSDGVGGGGMYGGSQGGQSNDFSGVGRDSFYGGGGGGGVGSPITAASGGVSTGMIGGSGGAGNSATSGVAGTFPGGGGGGTLTGTTSGAGAAGVIKIWGAV